MSDESSGARRVRLSIDVEPDLRRRIKIAAAQKDLSIKEYLETILRRALEDDESGGYEHEVHRVSSETVPRSFGREREEAKDRRIWET